MKSTNWKFIFLMAFLMSLIAFAIDAMMPAFAQMQSSFALDNPNSVQLVISMTFFGMSCGLLIYGPISDAYGRKKPLYLGIFIFIIGSIISMLAVDFKVMLLGRFLQGVGLAACRVITLAMVKDKFSGNEMGRIMSLVIMVFIIVPAIAPLIGQGILFVAPWQAIFALFVVLGCLAAVALFWWQRETLSMDKRIPLSWATIKSGTKETLSNGCSLGYIIASGLVFGILIGYLNSAQQILQVQFDLGESFVLYIGVIVLFISLSSYLNTKLIDMYGMYKLSLFALYALLATSLIYLLISYLSVTQSALTEFIIFISLSFLATGALYGNLITMALAPFGHIAGIANSIIGFLQTLISVIIGGIIGYMYDGTTYPLAIAFMLASLISILILVVINPNSKRNKLGLFSSSTKNA